MGLSACFFFWCARVFVCVGVSVYECVCVCVCEPSVYECIYTHI